MHTQSKLSGIICTIPQNIAVYCHIWYNLVTGATVLQGRKNLPYYA